ERFGRLACYLRETATNDGLVAAQGANAETALSSDDLRRQVHGARRNLSKEVQRHPIGVFPKNREVVRNPQLVVEGLELRCERQQARDLVLLHTGVSGADQIGNQLTERSMADDRRALR